MTSAPVEFGTDVPIPVWIEDSELRGFLMHFGMPFTGALEGPTRAEYSDRQEHGVR